MFDPFEYRIAFTIESGKNGKIVGANTFSMKHKSKKLEEKMMRITHRFVEETAKIYKKIYDEEMKQARGQKRRLDFSLIKKCPKL